MEIEHEHIKVRVLKRKLMKILLDDVVKLDDTVLRELGCVYSCEKWRANNFLLDLRGKWTYSRVACASDSVVGFWIASLLDDYTLHTHRVCVSVPFRGQGVAASMFLSIADMVSEGHKVRGMTLSVDTRNLRAIAFYRGLGFSILKGSSLEDFAIRWKKVAQSRGDSICISGNNLYVLKKKWE